MDRFFLTLFGLRVRDLVLIIDEVTQVLRAQIREAWMPELRELCYNIQPCFQEYYDHTMRHQYRLLSRRFYLGGEAYKQGMLPLELYFGAWLQFREYEHQVLQRVIVLEVMGDFECRTLSPELCHCIPNASLSPMIYPIVLGMTERFAHRLQRVDLKLT